MIHFQFVGVKIQRNLLFYLEVVIPIPSKLSFRLQFSEDERHWAAPFLCNDWYVVIFRIFRQVGEIAKGVY